MPPAETVIAALPKAEVHVHLEGCFDLADLMELAKAAGVPPPSPPAELFDLSDDDLGAFLRFLDWECGLVRTAEQAARAAYRFAARQSAVGVRYADVIVNPSHWSAWCGRLPALFDALAAGLDEAEQDGLCPANLCVSVLRQQSAGEAAELVDWLVDRRPSRVVALSVDGNEAAAGRTGPRFAEAFRTAARGGLRRTVHAGESSGPDGVWDALRLLGAERIDHGVRAVEDPDLVSYLRDHRIPLGVCPVSNVVLGLYDSLADHPLERLASAGVPVTLNTDDPATLGTSLVAVWAACTAAYDWDVARLVELARASVRASFAPDEIQRDLLAAIDAYAAGPAARETA